MQPSEIRVPIGYAPSGYRRDARHKWARFVNSPQLATAIAAFDRTGAMLTGYLIFDWRPGIMTARYQPARIERPHA